MPEMDGTEVCRQIRGHSTTPIIFLSSHDEEVDRIIGLELGGDDYVTKPFSPGNSLQESKPCCEEVKARIGHRREREKTRRAKNTDMWRLGTGS